MKFLAIGEVAHRSGFPASTLRYYEEMGLIRSTGRLGLKRLFDPDVLQQLALIALGREAGFSLEEIGAMFAKDGKPQIDRARLLAKADELEQSVRRLGALRDSLRHAAACPAPSHLECPSFQKLMRAAGLRHARPAGTRASTRQAKAPDRSNKKRGQTDKRKKGSNR